MRAAPSAAAAERNGWWCTAAAGACPADCAPQRVGRLPGAGSAAPLLCPQQKRELGAAGGGRGAGAAPARSDEHGVQGHADGNCNASRTKTLVCLAHGLCWFMHSERFMMDNYIRLRFSLRMMAIGGAIEGASEGRGGNDLTII